MTRRTLPFAHALVLFALSGAVAIGAEAAWFRALRLLFGSTAQAAGVLLAVYMTGLAVGAALGARVADSLRDPARAYALCEAVCALFALVSGTLLERAAGASLTLAVPWRILVALFVLAPPTLAMGATLPLVCAAVVPRRTDGFAPAIAALYGVNLAGGAIGSLVAGFVLLPRLGVRATLAVLACAGLAVASAAAQLAVRTDFTRDDPPPGLQVGSRIALVLAACTGVLSFALEVAWSRLFATLLGSSAYTFAALLGVVLASLAIGSVVGRGDEATDPRRFFARCARRLLALGIGVYTGTLVVYVAPAFLAATARQGQGTVLSRVGLLVCVVAPASYQIGALFPALASRLPEARPGRAAGFAQALCTAGNVVGALAAAFVAVPRWGVQTTLGLAAASALGLACFAAMFAGRAALRGMLLAAATSAWITSLLHPRWDPVGLAAGSFRVHAYRHQRIDPHDASCTPAHAFPHTRVLYARDGAHGAVTVLGHDGGPDCSLYSLRVDGKSEGSVLLAQPLGPRVPDHAVTLAAGDLPTNTLLGLLPALASETPPRRALLVGWGTGATARALLDGGTQRLLAFELEPAVLEAASRVFDARTPRDPRVDLRVDDARTALSREPTHSLDVVVSQPSNPWVSGAATLFSREFFALARTRLAPGGRMLAWVQLYEADRDIVRSLVATFLDVFPCTHAFRAGAGDLLLLGTTDTACDESQRADGSARRLAQSSDAQDALHRARFADVFARRLAQSSDARDALHRARFADVFARRLAQSSDARDALHRAGFADVAALMATRIAGPGDLARYAQGATVDTDDRAALEYRVADRVLSGRADALATILRGL